ncbi:hypothetical protein PMIN06_012138 [Paraphaeosphaeria minitans]
MQCFFPASGQQRYFIVSEPHVGEGNIAAPRADNEEIDRILEEYAGTQKEREQQAQVMDAEVAKTDRTGWWKFTEWPEHFANRNCAHLAHAIRLPQRDEPKLKQAAHIVERLIEKSVHGLSSLPRETRRWLRSAQIHEADQRPIARLQNPESQARCTGYLVIFVCYVLRIIADEEAGGGRSSSKNEDSEDSDDTAHSDSSEEGSQAHPSRQRAKVDLIKDARELFRWQGQQKALASMLWQMLDEENEEAQLSALLQMLSAFIFTSYIRSPFECGLVHFMAVLGFDAEMGRLRTAKNYAYMVAGIVYCVRVIGVKYLLPSALREEQGAGERDRFLVMRRQFLADGSFSPMSQLISLLAYGKFVSMNAGNTGNAFWSEDKTIFYLHGKPIFVHHFQLMAQALLTELEDRLWGELLWIADPAQRFRIRLDLLRDDVTYTRRGMSFVTHGNNGLENGLRWMLAQMMQAAAGQKLRSAEGAWKRAEVKRYLRCVKRFKEVLLVANHIMAGQPGRGTEITTLRHRNGALQDRNVFVLDGQVMTVVRYYKSQSQWDKPKVIPRFLPSRLSQVVVVYLAYLQPFEEYLTVLGGSFSDYMWANEQGPIRYKVTREALLAVEFA